VFISLALVVAFPAGLWLSYHFPDLEQPNQHPEMGKMRFSPWLLACTFGNSRDSLTLSQRKNAGLPGGSVFVTEHETGQPHLCTAGRNGVPKTEQKTWLFQKTDDAFRDLLSGTFCLCAFPRTRETAAPACVIRKDSATIDAFASPLSGRSAAW
jgi:hypothetical protein